MPPASVKPRIRRSNLNAEQFPDFKWFCWVPSLSWQGGFGATPEKAYETGGPLNGVA